MRALIISFLFSFLIGAAMAGSLRLRIIPAYQNLTTTQLHQALLQTSTSRALHFKLPSSSIASSPAPLPSSSPVSRGYGGLYYVEVLIGTPPLLLNMAIDTASSPTWVQSAQCMKCFNVTTPNYDATNSATFSRMNSNDGLCVEDFLYPQGQYCGYEVDYAVNQVTIGDFGYDSFSTLFSDDETTTQLAFGLGIYNRMIDFKGEPQHPNEMAGILGLARDHPSSLVHQLASIAGIKKQFSYRLPSHSGDQGLLVFGDDAQLKCPEVQTTPILGKPEDFYYLNLEGISVNGSLLPIDPKLFMSEDYEGVVIDSGSQYTLLVNEAYNVLQQAVVDYFFPREPLPLSHSGFDICYDMEDNASEFYAPPMVFHFRQGANLSLAEPSTFKAFQDVGEYCFMILPTKEISLPNIIGAQQQIGYSFLFDVGRSQLSFAPDN